jgi:hypothetical protein
MDQEEIDEAMFDYIEEFGHTITFFGLTPEQMEKAVPVLAKAMDDGVPLTDAEFYPAIGLEPPPKDAET